jgi:DNA repair photolyase
VILIKRNLPEVLAREMARPSWAHETVAIGTATDPYQPAEGEAQITRRCVEVLTTSRTPFSIVTKGPMVVRDLDLLARATREAGCHVFLSVPSVDTAACAKLEPGTAPPLQRLRAARRLLEAGIDVAVLMMPLVPGITTARSVVAATVEAIAESGVRLAGVGVAHLDDGMRDHFLTFLAAEYPELLDGYQRLYRGKYAPDAYVQAVRATVAAVMPAGLAARTAASPSGRGSDRQSADDSRRATSAPASKTAS